MNVLVITGDKSFGPGHPRFELQKSVVERLDVVYWGRGSVWPKLPKEKFDVVTAQDPFWRGLFAWRAARKLKAKFNVQVHTDLDVQPLVRHILAQIVLRHAGSIRTVSEKIAEQVKRIGVRAPVSVLPIFVDVSAFKTLQPKAHDTKTILWLGRFEKEKDPLYALEVLKGVQKIMPAKLIMLGSGSLDAELKKTAQGLDVEFPGWQDPKSFLQIADVVVCTSHHESFGASMIEALAAGVPVVAPDVGIAREAGAVVVPREQLAEAAVGFLASDIRGQLQLDTPSASVWAELWKKTL